MMFGCVRAGVRGDTAVIRQHHAGHRTEKLGTAAGYTRNYTLHRDSAILRSQQQQHQQQQGWGDRLGFYVSLPSEAPEETLHFPIQCHPLSNTF